MSQPIHANADNDAPPYALACSTAVEPSQNEHGFYLLDDAGGRFVVDRDFGVISLRDDESLESERGSIHTARLRVIEPSGVIYELDMRLCLSGRVPQLVTEDDIEPACVYLGAPTPEPLQSWTAFAVAAGAPGKAPLLAATCPFGGVLDFDLPAIAGLALVATDAALAPAPATALWSI